MYLLDSDVLINFLEKGVDFPHPFTGKKDCLSVISYYEIKYGTVKVKKEPLFDEFVNKSQIKIIGLDQKIVNETIRLRILLEKKGERLDDLDLFIAATALINSLVLVTGNKKHFDRIKNLQLF